MLPLSMSAFVILREVIKASGPDNISAEHLQFAHPSLVMHIKMLIQYFMLNAWLHLRVTNFRIIIIIIIIIIFLTLVLHSQGTEY